MRSLYRRPCDLCKQDKIGMYAPDKPHIAFCPRCWWSDGWDGFDYGCAFDFSRSFFVQFAELLRRVPLIARSVYEDTLVNSEYTNMAHSLKDCYLVFLSVTCERSAYCQSIDGGKDCLDVSWSNDVQLCYEGINLHNCYKVFYSKDCLSCSHSYFLNDCVNCSNCFGCAGLRNKQYHIFNEPYSPEQYADKLKEIGFQSEKYSSVKEFKQRAKDLWSCYPVKYVHGSNNQDASGDYIYNAKNTKHSFFVNAIEDSKFCSLLMFGKPVRESYDWTQYGDNGELMYEVAQSGGGVYNNHFGWMILRGCRDVEYCALMNNCSDCFGCVGLKNKKFCIFNTQYTEDEYRIMRKRIIVQMAEMPYIDAKGRMYRYGEFFPPELSPFAYNESAAQEEFPLTEKEAGDRGFLWRDEKQDVSYTITKQARDLPDASHENGDFTKDIIGCESCGKGYRFVKMELAFYRDHHIPLPRTCSNCRYQERLEWRGRTLLTERQCQCGGAKSQNGMYKNTAQHAHGGAPCPMTFQTAYAKPEGRASTLRPEIVYCAECYQGEVI
ncbi:hypothetical protein HY623_03465 [Candidatus Uhrbacteria bacterium]|nr:hypothetical protein [Candidatus Uhrbacteria bacterium]